MRHLRERKRSHQSGFTLLELLVALVLFSLVGLGAHVMLQSAIGAREAGQEHALKLERLQKAVWIMEQDLAQAQPGSFVAGQDYAARFTRIGWRNPLALPRSNRQRVAYAIDGGQLVRYYGDLPGALSRQVLLERVSAFAVRRLEGDAVEFVLDTRDFGPIRRVIEVPSL